MPITGSIINNAMKVIPKETSEAALKALKSFKLKGIEGNRNLSDVVGKNIKDIKKDIFEKCGKNERVTKEGLVPRFEEQVSPEPLEEPLKPSSTETIEEKLEEEKALSKEKQEQEEERPRKVEKALLTREIPPHLAELAYIDESGVLRNGKLNSLGF